MKFFHCLRCGSSRVLARGLCQWCYANQQEAGALSRWPQAGPLDARHQAACDAIFLEFGCGGTRRHRFALTSIQRLWRRAARRYAEKRAELERAS